MRSKRAAKVAAFKERWSKEATLHEVVQFTALRFEQFMLGYSDSYRARNDLHMQENVKMMRGIVTRLDQFRRVQARKWAKQDAEKLKEENETP